MNTLNNLTELRANLDDIEQKLLKIPDQINEIEKTLNGLKSNSKIVKNNMDDLESEKLCELYETQIPANQRQAHLDAWKKENENYQILKQKSLEISDQIQIEGLELNRLNNLFRVYGYLVEIYAQKVELTRTVITMEVFYGITHKKDA